MVGIVDLGDLERVAVEALRRADRPPWGNPLVIALELGFEMLPRLPGTSPELTETSTAQIVFAAEPGAEPHAARVRLALAHGLLLRAEIPHAPADSHWLARRLRQIPE